MTWIWVVGAVTHVRLELMNKCRAEAVWGLQRRATAVVLDCVSRAQTEGEQHVGVVKHAIRQH
jgi:hypothetical protein